MPDDTLRYQRSRFTTRLPTGRLFTRGHFWLLREPDESGEPGIPGVWRIGLTKFAVRMLGELVEHEFEVQPGDAVKTGQVIGWLEGFKAASDLYCVADGSFAGGNEKLVEDITLVESDPYGEGWLYRVRGQPDAAAFDVTGYTKYLDDTIDRMQGQHDAGLLDDDRDAAEEKC
jgi:glycine cleavage system H protein